MEQTALNEASTAPEVAQITYHASMRLFTRKTMTEKLEAEITVLRARADTLRNRHATAEAAFADAKAKLQHHHLEADLDADDKVRAKLEAAVAACTLTRDGYADALGEVQTKIAEAERAYAAERSAAERKAASEKLSRDLDVVERALPDYLTAARHFAHALEQIHFHFESGAMARFVGDTTMQVEVAAGFAVAELRAMVGAIRDGVTPIPAAKAGATSTPAPEPVPPTQTIFMMRSAKYRDHNGRSRFAGQWEDATMPVATAQRALRQGVAVPLTDPRRAQLRGARGGDFNPQAADVVDLDAVEERKAVPHMQLDPVLHDAGFVVIDRSAETRMIEIEVPRL